MCNTLVRNQGKDIQGFKQKELRLLFVVDSLQYHENFSIPILTAIAHKHGCRVELLEYARGSRYARRYLEQFRPDIVAYSICSNQAAEYQRINLELKKIIPFFSVFGGAHPTFSPSFINNEGVDACCRGEADFVLGEFLDAFNTEGMYEVPNFSFKKAGRIISNPLKPLNEDLDALPLPARDIVYKKNHFLSQNPIKPFMASRGCPYQCSYCFNHAYHDLYRGKGAVVRFKSVDYILREIQDVKRRYPLTFIKFHDDIFGLKKEWFEEFAQRYPQEIGLPFLCYVRPDIITDKYCSLLKKAGCYSVAMGVECGNEDSRREFLNKNISDDVILCAGRLLHKYGIRIFTFNMIGLPQETEDSIWETIVLNHAMGADFAEAYIFQPYPGTKIEQLCLDRGFVDKDHASYGSIHHPTVLNFSKTFKERLPVYHDLFSLLAARPQRRWLLKFFLNAPGIPFRTKMLTAIDRIYYGLNLHKKIYASKIPWYLRIHGALIIMFSKHRT